MDYLSKLNYYFYPSTPAEMTAISNEDLVKRIARLAKQNQELEEEIKRLEKLSEKLLRENEKLKALSASISSTIVKGKKKREYVKGLSDLIATLLFTGIRGFSKLIQDMDSASLMDELDEILFEFETIIGRYRIEKIKTIGDTFMCAGDSKILPTLSMLELCIGDEEFIDKYEFDKGEAIKGYGS